MDSNRSPTQRNVATAAKATFVACVMPSVYIVSQVLVMFAMAVPRVLSAMLNGAGGDFDDVYAEVASDLLGKTTTAVIISCVLTVAVAVTIIAMRREGVVKTLKLHAPRVWQVALALFLGAALNLTMICIIALIPIPETVLGDYNQQMESVLTGGSALLTFLALGIAAPVAEEVVFRGWAMNRLRKGMPLAAAVLLQSAIFAVAHGNPLQIVYVLPIAVVFGLLYGWSGNLWVTIAAHVGFNAFAVVLDTLTPSISADSAETLELAGQAGGVVYLTIAIVGLAIVTACILQFRRTNKNIERETII